MTGVAIALGGIAGAFARYGAGMMASGWHASPFPWGTLGVNVAGSLVLGTLMQVLPPATGSPAVRAGLTVGFCGGFTTFSTFAYETIVLARGGDLPLAGAYVTVSLLLGPSAVMAGLAIGGTWTGRRSRLPPRIAPVAERPADADEGPPSQQSDDE